MPPKYYDPWESDLLIDDAYYKIEQLVRFTDKQLRKERGSAWRVVVSPSDTGASYEATTLTGEVEAESGVAVAFDIKEALTNPKEYFPKFAKSVVGTDGILSVWNDFPLAWERDFYSKMMRDQQKLWDDIGVMEDWTGIGFLVRRWELPDQLINNVNPADNYKVMKARLVEASGAKELEDDIIVQAADALQNDNVDNVTVVVDDPNGGDLIVGLRNSNPTDPEEAVIAVDRGEEQLVVADQAEEDTIVADEGLVINSSGNYGIDPALFVYEEDLIAGFMGSVDNFLALDKVALKRDTAFRGVQKSAFEVYREVLAPGHAGVVNSKAYKDADPAKVGELLGDTQWGASLPLDKTARGFVLETDIAMAMSNLDYNLSELSKTMTDYVNRNSALHLWQGLGDGPQIGDDGLPITEIEKRLKNNLESIKEDIDNLFGEGFNPADGLATDESLIGQVRALYADDAGQLAEFNSMIKPLEDFQEKLRVRKNFSGGLEKVPIWEQDPSGVFTLIAPFKQMDANTFVRTVADNTNLKIFISQFNALRGKLTGGPISSGPLVKYFDYLEGKITNKRSAINRYMRSAGFPQMNGISDLLGIMRRKRNWEFSGELLEQLQGGTLTRYLFWFNGISFKNRIVLFTAAHFINTFLTKSHYFGLKTWDDPVKYNTYKWAQNMVKNKGFYIGGRLIQLPWMFDNKFKITFGGITASVVGGEHFKEGLRLFDLLSEKGIFNAKFVVDPLDGTRKIIRFTDNGALITMFMNLPDGASFQDFLAFLHANGIVLPIKPEDLEKIYNKLVKFKKYLRSHPELSKLFFDSRGRFIASKADSFGDFLLQLKVMSTQNFVTNITKETIGILEKISTAATALQHRIYELINKIPGGNFVKRLLTIKTAISEAFASAVTGVLAAGTGGILGAAAPFIERAISVATRWVLDKVESFGKAVLKGNIEGFLKDMEETVENLAKAVMKGMLIVAMFFFLVSTVILNMLASIVPENPSKLNSEETSGLTIYQSGGGFVGDGPVGDPGGAIVGNCSAPGYDPRTGPTPSNGLPQPTNRIAQRAWEINNGLSAGFWCYWNYSADYPLLFNIDQYFAHPRHCTGRFDDGTPYPSGCTGDPEAYINLFWCTYLVVKSFNETGNSFPVALWTPSMANVFRDRGKFIEPGERVVGEAQPGDAFFTHICEAGSCRDRLGHVSIIHSITEDYIITMDSNAYSKKHTFTIDAAGVVQDTPYFKFGGIGKQ